MQEGNIGYNFASITEVVLQVSESKKAFGSGSSVFENIFSI